MVCTLEDGRDMHSLLVSMGAGTLMCWQTPCVSTCLWAVAVYNCCAFYAGLRPLPSGRCQNAYFWHTCIVMLHARWGGGPCGTTNHSIPSLMG